MGNFNGSQPSLQQPNINQWTLKQQLPTHNVWVNKKDPKYEIEQYQINLHNEKTFNQEKKSYYLRKEHPQLVASKYFKQQSKRDFCASLYKGKLYLQRIPIRLSSVKDIPFPDIIHFVNQVLKGAKILTRQKQPFYVSQDHIGINQEGIVKIWLNKDYQKTFHDEEACTQQKMVRNILQMLEFNADNRLLPAGILNFFYAQNVNLKFNDAIQKLEEYAKAYNNGQIPDKLFCINQLGGMQAIQSYQRKFQHKNKTLQGAQHVPLITEAPYQRAITQFPRQYNYPIHHQNETDRKVKAFTEPQIQESGVRTNLITLQQRIERTKKTGRSQKRASPANFKQINNFVPIYIQNANQYPNQVIPRNLPPPQKKIINNLIYRQRQDQFSHLTSSKINQSSPSQVSQLPSMKTYSNVITNSRLNAGYTERSQFRYNDINNFKAYQPDNIKEQLDRKSKNSQLLKKQQIPNPMNVVNRQTLIDKNSNINNRAYSIKKYEGNSNTFHVQRTGIKPQDQRNIHSYKSFGKVPEMQIEAKQSKQLIQGLSQPKIQQPQRSYIQKLENLGKQYVEQKQINIPKYTKTKQTTSQFISEQKKELIGRRFQQKISQNNYDDNKGNQIQLLQKGNIVETILNNDKNALQSYQASPNRQTQNQNYQQYKVKERSEQSYQIEILPTITPKKQEQKYVIEWDPQILADLKHLHDDEK